jgi:hypothetical protein
VKGAFPQALGLLVVGFLANQSWSLHRVWSGFNASTEGDALSVVLDRTGAPTRIYGLFDVPGHEGKLGSVCGKSCVLRLEYDLPFTLGAKTLAFDFDARHKLMHKAEMTSA